LPFYIELWRHRTSELKFSKTYKKIGAGQAFMVALLPGNSAGSLIDHLFRLLELTDIF